MRIYDTEFRKILFDTTISGNEFSHDESKYSFKSSQTLMSGLDPDEHFFLQCLSQNDYDACLEVDFLNGGRLPVRRIPELRKKTIQKIRAKGEIPPLGFLYKLDKCKILSFEQFLSGINCSKEVFLEAWKKENDDIILVSWMERLIVLESPLIITLLDWIVHQSILENGSACNFFESLNDKSTLERDDLKKFYSKVINIFITWNPNIKVITALNEQENWRNLIINSLEHEVRRNLFIEMIIPFNDLSEVMNIYKKILKRKEVNWFHCLSLLALVHSYDRVGVTKEVNDLVMYYLNAGFNEKNTEYMVTAFLLIRQVYLPDASKYARWFETTFSGQSSKTNLSRANYEFFVMFLTSLVPHEKSHYLKAHLSKTPSVPSTNLKTIYADYINLAKTRLADILDEKKREEENMLFSDIPPEIVIEVDNDIKGAIKSLNSTGKLPSKLLQASIFKKPYFNRYFLNRLLLTVDKTQETIHLVEALAKKGKISKNMIKLFEERKS
ncbi:Fanconi anemia group A protein isoform X2 [Lepeophtheirus salmonis]|uniref:Fanconi anemia group A protein isoform X2 n=1 Tax=Lepeophtheirus salmonis TaxID=72036 RepID=UPI001AE3C474|nr:Fanconi anemia group A protein-like isoform X2 [Lepeophtheirus salmonis]